MISKVLLAHNFYRQRGGEDSVFENEKRLLLDNGIDVVSFEKHNEDIRDQSLASLARHALSMTWNKDTYREITILIKRHKPDIAHFHNTFQLISPSAYAACQDNNVPVVQTLHNYRLFCPGGILQRAGRPCEICVGKLPIPAVIHRCYQGSALRTAAVDWMLIRNRLNGSYRHRVDRYVALTEFAAGKFAAGGLIPSRIAVKPNFLLSPPTAGLGGGRFAVYIGRLSGEKGIQTLLNAWKRTSGIVLKIIGDGPLAPVVEDAARQSHGTIEWLGFMQTDRIMDIVRNAEMMILPSECYEGFPMTLLEAYACGTPVVASRIGSLDELVKEGLTGFKFTPGDASALSDLITRLWGDLPGLHALRKGIRQHFDDHYSTARNYRLLMAIYEETRQQHCAALDHR